MRACARAQRRWFFSSNNHKMSKEVFFKLVKVKFEKYVSQVQKEWKINVYSVDFSQKIKFLFVQKMHARALGGKFFFWVLSNMLKREFFKFVRTRIEKQVSEVRKTWKTPLYLNQFSSFLARVADIKVTEAYARLRPFSKSHNKYFIPNFEMGFFLYTCRYLLGK